MLTKMNYNNLRYFFYQTLQHQGVLTSIDLFMCPCPCLAFMPHRKDSNSEESRSKILVCADPFCNFSNEFSIENCAPNETFCFRLYLSGSFQLTLGFLVSPLTFSVVHCTACKYVFIQITLMYAVLVIL